MNKYLKDIRNYEEPDWDEVEDFHSYFDHAKANQENLQKKILKEQGKSESLASELAEATHAHSDLFFRQVGGEFNTECESGCSYCCHQPATAFPFEAIQIAGRLKARCTDPELAALKSKLRERVLGFKGTVRENANNKMACPLLKDHNCSVYEDRPMTCRMAHSFSMKKCLISFQKDRNKADIPVSMELISALSGMIEGVYEKLPNEGLDAKLYELSSVVLAALEEPDAARKWASADASLFKDCIRDDT